MRTKCIAETRTGSPCSRWVTKGRYCTQHYMTPEQEEVHAMFQGFAQVLDEVFDHVAAAFDEDLLDEEDQP